MKDLIFIQACPDDDYYIWQVNLWLESLKERGFIEKAVSLIFTPHSRKVNIKWKGLEKNYPEAKFIYISGPPQLNGLISIYIPIIRPFCLMEYFKLHPENNNKAIFYCDSDILFTENFDISKYIEDDVCYLSDTNSYINATYFDSKVKDVKPEKLEDYKKRDILEEATSLIGVSREIAEKNNEHSGGAQYLLKNVDYEFWEKVLGDCIKIRIYLRNINGEFFENESKGFQSWCADMWAVLWNLWYHKKEVKVIPEMDFAWSTSPISELKKVGIFHNAGIVGEKHGEIPVFYKGKYHKGLNPLLDPYLEQLFKNEKNKTLANNYYIEKIIQLKNKSVQYDLEKV